jgi:hypothetical protein
MNQTVTVSAVLTATDPTATFYTVTGTAPSDANLANLANLATENYPDRPEPVITYTTITTPETSTFTIPTNAENMSNSDFPKQVITHISSTTYTISTITYPIPIVTHEQANQLNRENQLIFKGQTVQWWVESLNNKSVVYTPHSNKVSWAYVTASGDRIHISTEITNLFIPRTSDTFTSDDATRTSVAGFPDNGYMSMSCTYSL